jgi:hypothetical protein
MPVLVLRFLRLEFSVRLRLSGISSVKCFKLSNVSANIVVTIFMVQWLGFNCAPSTFKCFSLITVMSIRPVDTVALPCDALDTQPRLSACYSVRTGVHFCS